MHPNSSVIRISKVGTELSSVVIVIMFRDVCNHDAHACCDTQPLLYCAFHHTTTTKASNRKIFDQAKHERESELLLNVSHRTRIVVFERLCF